MKEYKFTKKTHIYTLFPRLDSKAYELCDVDIFRQFHLLFTVFVHQTD